MSGQAEIMQVLQNNAGKWMTASQIRDQIQGGHASTHKRLMCLRKSQMIEYKNKNKIYIYRMY